ncbi:MAG: hypothetical protein P4L33_01345 [Capsulimonadaceae bacterium]|nr:hypothetical protein [Capsulimonadaceae bacterium]
MMPLMNRIAAAISFATLASAGAFAQHIVSVGPVTQPNNQNMQGAHVVGPITAFQVQAAASQSARPAPPPNFQAPPASFPYLPVSSTYIYLGDDSDSVLTFGGPSSITNLGSAPANLSVYPTSMGYTGFAPNLYTLPAGATITAPAQQPAVAAPSYSGAAPVPAVTNIYNQYTTNNYYYGGAPLQSSTASQSSDGNPPGQFAGSPSPVAGLSGVDSTAFAQALHDIARSWLRGDVGFLKTYLSSDVKVDVYAKGVYENSIDSAKLASMTDDTYDQIVTRAFTFDTIQPLQNGDVRAYGKQVYNLRISDDRDGEKVMFVEYTLGKRAGRWVIVSTDSAPTPLVEPQSGTGSLTSTVAK